MHHHLTNEATTNALFFLFSPFARPLPSAASHLVPSVSLVAVAVFGFRCGIDRRLGCQPVDSQPAAFTANRSARTRALSFLSPLFLPFSFPLSISSDDEKIILPS
jgi:hypothetical protein